MNQPHQQFEANGHNYMEATQAFESGHFSKASKILRRALQESETTGKVDPQLVRSAQNLAERYFLDGMYSDAASMYRTVLEVRTRLLGEEHPDVRESRRKLAMALWQTGGLSPRELAAYQ